jgi:hypothetical protein
VRRYATIDRCAKGGDSKRENAIQDGKVLVLGELGGTCFGIVQQVPLVFLRFVAPILVCPHSAWPRRAWP